MIPKAEMAKHKAIVFLRNAGELIDLFSTPSDLSRN